MWGTAKLQLMSGFLNPSQIFLPQRFAFQGRVRSKRRCSKQPRPGPTARRRAEPQSWHCLQAGVKPGDSPLIHRDWGLGLEAWTVRSTLGAAPGGLCALESLQLNSHSELAQHGDSGAGGAGWAELEGRKREEIFQGQRGLSLCCWRQGRQQGGQAGLGAAGAQGFWAVFFAEHLQRGSWFSLCRVATLFFFPYCCWFSTPFWNTDRTVSFRGAVCMQTLLKFSSYIIWVLVLFCFKSSSHKERCGLTKWIFLQLASTV